MTNRRKILIRLAYAISAMLLILVVFFSSLWLLNRFATLSPIILGGGPDSPISNSFPPAPSFVKLSGIYFDSPRLLKDINVIDSAGIFLILCQKDGDYGIIYIGETRGGGELSVSSCWSDSCGESLYISEIRMPTEQYRDRDRQALRKSLEEENNPSCVLRL